MAFTVTEVARPGRRDLLLLSNIYCFDPPSGTFEMHDDNARRVRTTLGKYYLLVSSTMQLGFDNRRRALVR